MSYQERPDQQDTSEQDVQQDDPTRIAGESFMDEVNADRESGSGFGGGTQASDGGTTQGGERQTPSELTFSNNLYDNGEGDGLNLHTTSEGSGDDSQSRTPGSSSNPADRIGQQEAGAEPPAGREPGRPDSETDNPERQTGRAPGEGLNQYQLPEHLKNDFSQVKIPVGDGIGLPYIPVSDDSDYSEHVSSNEEKDNKNLSDQVDGATNTAGAAADTTIAQIAVGNTNPGVDLGAARSALNGARAAILGAADSDRSLLSKLGEISSVEGSVNAAQAKLDLAKVAVANGVDSAQLTQYFNMMSAGHSRESAIKFAGSRSESA